MGKESGKHVLLKVGNGATPTEVFTALKGQKDTRMALAANAIDVSDKTTDGWGSTIPGTKQATVTISGYPEWPDADGITILRQKFLDEESVNCQLVMNVDGDMYEGPFSITAFEEGGANDGATEYSITLQNSGAVVWVPAA